MIWASFRLQRLQLLTLLGLVVIGVVAIALLRADMLDDMEFDALTGCVTIPLEACTGKPEAVQAFGSKWSDPFDAARLALLSAPALIGIFIGAPLFARELEQGTHVLAFTQSVSRTRWMLVKVLIVLVPSLLALGALQSALWWWMDTAGTLGPQGNGPFNPITFGVEHASPSGYALFAFALSAFIGVLTRRVLVAMTAGLGAFVVTRFALSGVVDALAPVRRLEAAADKPLNAYRDNSLVLAQGWLDSSGQPVPKDEAATIVQNCKSAPGKQADPSQWDAAQEKFLACLPRSGLAKDYADVVPSNLAWQVHLVDLAVYGVLGALLLAGTAWALRRQS